MRLFRDSCILDRKSAAFCTDFSRSGLLALIAIVIIFSPFLGWRAEAAAEETPPFGDAGSRSILKAPGDIIIESVVAVLDTLYPGQTGIPVRVDVRNGSNTQILVQSVGLVFTFNSPGDRNSDYLISGDFLPAAILNPGETASFDLTVDVLETALSDEWIAVDAYVKGQRLDNFEDINDSTTFETVVERHVVLTIAR